MSETLKTGFLPLRPIYVLNVALCIVKCIELRLSEKQLWQLWLLLHTMSLLPCISCQTHIFDTGYQYESHMFGSK